jgi:hypothetical protein
LRAVNDQKNKMCEFKMGENGHENLMETFRHSHRDAASVRQTDAVTRTGNMEEGEGPVQQAFIESGNRFGFYRNGSRRT